MLLSDETLIQMSLWRSSVGVTEIHNHLSCRPIPDKLGGLNSIHWKNLPGEVRLPGGGIISTCGWQLQSMPRSSSLPDGRRNGSRLPDLPLQPPQLHRLVPWVSLEPFLLLVPSLTSPGRIQPPFRIQSFQLWYFFKWERHLPSYFSVNTDLYFLKT